MIIKVLGSGCANCTKLEIVAVRAAEELGVDATIEKVTDIAQIMSYGIMATPGLVIDDSVKVSGRVPSLDEVKRIIAEAR